MFINGVLLMVVGMLVVFLFLTLIVFVMRIMSSVILKYFPEKEVPAASIKKAQVLGDDAEIAVAIAAVAAR